jgi:hypothetical protein
MGERVQSGERSGGGELHHGTYSCYSIEIVELLCLVMLGVVRPGEWRHLSA